MNVFFSFCLFTLFKYIESSGGFRVDDFEVEYFDEYSDDVKEFFIFVKELVRRESEIFGPGFDFVLSEIDEFFEKFDNLVGDIIIKFS